MHLSFLIAEGLLIIFLLAALYKSHLDSKETNQRIELDEKNANRHFELIDNLSKKNVEYKLRVTELEDSIEKGYGVKIRNEVTEVIADFNKLEMIVLYAGISKLLEGKTTPADAEIYINLCKKIQGFIDKMKEDELKALSKKGK